jgi:membrane-associated phospholipid phosphatase
VARNVKSPLAACFACAVALGLLVVFAFGVDASRDLDARLFLRLAEHRHSTAGSWGNVIAALGDLGVLLGALAIACAIAFLRGRPSDALAAVLVVAGANVTTQLLKILLAHPRVKTAIGGDPFESNTFPSGHTTSAASIAIAYLFVVPARLRAPTLALGTAITLAVGCSVVVIGWHRPSDVLGGLLVAAGWGFAVLAARRAIGSRASRFTVRERQSPRPAAISAK